MSSAPEKGTWRQKLLSWVDGEREPKDQTLFVMERRPPRLVHPSEEEQERRERYHLRRFFNWYPFAAVAICLLLTAVLLTAALKMPL
ncbi:MAG: hypothetical protein PHD67_10785, partial [Oscillospiraceae bacterium]|nr:hypothetical protein [Oscillospiraceae bacterium]